MHAIPLIAEITWAVVIAFTEGLGAHFPAKRHVESEYVDETSVILGVDYDAHRFTRPCKPRRGNLYHGDRFPPFGLIYADP